MALRIAPQLTAGGPQEAFAVLLRAKERRSCSTCFVQVKIKAAVDNYKSVTLAIEISSKFFRSLGIIALHA